MEIKIEGNPEHFSYQKLEEYRKKFAQMLSIPQHKVRFEALREGCVVIIFLMPSECTFDLMTMARDNRQWLVDLDVIGVHVQDEEFIPLNSISKGKLL